MKGLILKDLYTIRSQFWVIVFYVVMLSVIGMIGHVIAAFTPTFMLLIGMMPIIALSADERSKWGGYAVSLPVTTATAVISKYMLSFILTGPIMIYVFITYIASTGIHTPNVVLDGTYYTILIASLGVIALSITLPLIFRFGTEKGRILVLFIYALFCIGFGALVVVVSTDLFNRQLADLPLLNMLKSNMLISVLIILIVSILSLILSINLSIRIYKKKEF